MPSFNHRLREIQAAQNSLLCVGLDPNLTALPLSRFSRDMDEQADLLLQFNREIIDACAPYVCAFKPQIAHYSAYGWGHILLKTIEYIRETYPKLPVILDAKRGDIADTAKMYAAEAFAHYLADAVTVNPYFGGDSLAPFLAYAAGGTFVLCQTSNLGSAEIQQLKLEGRGTVAQEIARLAANEWNENQNVGLVVGATWPAAMGEIRQIVGDHIPFLVPGIGTQGGDLAAVLANGLTKTADGLVINVSRAILYAASGADFAKAAGNKARQIRNHINRLRST